VTYGAFTHLIGLYSFLFNLQNMSTRCKICAWHLRDSKILIWTCTDFAIYYSEN